jgi:hypothetical protein
VQHDKGRHAINATNLGKCSCASSLARPRAKARVELERLLKLSTERYVSPYNIAMIYHGLGEREATFAWLELAYRQREPRMVFLNAEPKWGSLRDEPRFQGLLQRVGFTR